MTSMGDTRKTKAKARESRRRLVPPDLNALLIAVQRDYLRARDRYESLRAVLGSHTLWEHEDGRDLCDMDGEEWPCSTVTGMAFVYDVHVREPWEQGKTQRGDANG